MSDLCELEELIEYLVSTRGFRPPEATGIVSEVLSFLADALGELGHRVDTCPGAVEALRQLDASSPDLMLIDFAMPGCNGAELARQVRARRPDQRIAFVTGYAESEQIDDALGSDAPVLRKPFSIEELATMIGDQLAAPQG